MLYYMNWLTHDFWTRTGGWEFDRSHGAGTSSPSHSQQVEEQAPKPVGWTMCFLLMTLVPVQKLCVNNIYIYIYMYVHSTYEFCYRTYIYIYIYIYIYTTGVAFSIGEAAPHHVLWDCISGEWAVPGLNGISLVYQLCLALWYKSNTRMFWHLVFVLNNTWILGIWCSTIPHLPGCFCSWTFFENIGFNTVLTDPFMSHLPTQLGYSAGEFQALQLIVLAAVGVVD